MESAVLKRPEFTKKLREKTEARTLEFESDGQPSFREFSAWGMTVNSAWTDDKTGTLSIIENEDGTRDVEYHVAAGSKVFVSVTV